MLMTNGETIKAATDEQLQAILMDDKDAPRPKCSWPRRLSAANWIVALSHPRQERVGAATLKRHGYEPWYPTCKTIVLPPRDKVTSSKRNNLAALAKVEEQPVYRGYILVRDSIAIHSIFDLIRDQHPGLRGLMAIGSSLAKVTDAQVAKLRKDQEDGRYDVSTSSVPFPYKVGDKISLKQFYGHTAVIEALDESDNAHLMARMFGGECRVVMSRDDLVAAATE